MAGVTAQQAAKLGADLTPMGGEKAANAAGTIPAWTGGITSAAQAGAPGFKSGGHHPDPYANEKPLYKVDAANASKYAANLTAGHKALLNAYKGSYFMNVYPSHRSAAFPQRIYDATKANATSAKLSDGGNGVTGAIGGVPFPIPQSGVEVIWNHILRFRAEIAERVIGQAAVTRAGGVQHGQVPRRDLRRLRPAGRDRGGARQRRAVLHPGNDCAGAARGRDPARPRDARPDR